MLNTVQACQVPKPWTLEGHLPVEQNILLDAGGYAISKDDSALTEEDVYELANRYVAFVSDNLAYIDLLTEFAYTTGSTVAFAVGAPRWHAWLQFGLQFTTVPYRPERTGQRRWSSLNRSERLRPELLMR